MQARHFNRGSLTWCSAIAAAVLASTLGTAWPNAQGQRWADYEARIQYAFFTEDPRTLGSLSQQLSDLGSHEHLADYYLALASYRSASLSGQGDAVRADAAQRCAQAAERALASESGFTEAEILDAACLDLIAHLKSLRAPLASNRARKRLDHALSVAPANPRVLLIAAAEQPPAAAEQMLRRALERFSAERQSVTDGPSWGESEGYLALSQLQLARAEVLPARDSLEHALLLAPDFAAARRQLAEITAR